jgi:hypothetical protein
MSLDMFKHSIDALVATLDTYNFLFFICRAIVDYSVLASLTET